MVTNFNLATLSLIFTPKSISLSHSLVESLRNFFWLLIWELMDASPTSNRSDLPRTTVALSQNTPGCICLWALTSPCCQRFDHLFVWILPFDLPGMVRPARSWSFCQYSSQWCGITQAPPPLQDWWFWRGRIFNINKLDFQYIRQKLPQQA